VIQPVAERQQIYRHRPRTSAPRDGHSHQAGCAAHRPRHSAYAHPGRHSIHAEPPWGTSSSQWRHSSPFSGDRRRVRISSFKVPLRAHLPAGRGDTHRLLGAPRSASYTGSSAPL
jgi:hypothetical protein